MFCQKCGTKKEGDAKFCASCGNEFEPTAIIEKTEKQKEIKCGNCNYVGPGESARTQWVKILAWISIIFAPIITLLYFVFTHPYRCPKCKSTFVGVKNKQGFFESKNSSARVLKILLFGLLGIAVVGILSSIVLASLTTARQKALSSKIVLAVEQIKKGIIFPQQMNDSVQLTDILAGTSTIKYYYSIDTGELISAPSVDSVKTSLIKEICSDSDTRAVVDQNIGMEYIYTYVGSDTTLDAIIRKEDCK